MFRGGPAGFWETYFGINNLGFIIQQLTDKLDAIKCNFIVACLKLSLIFLKIKSVYVLEVITTLKKNWKIFMLKEN